MTAGEQLMVACLKKGDSKVMSMIQKRWLDGGEVRQYMFIMDYYKEHGELLGIKTFIDKFSLDSTRVDSRPTYYLNAVKERFLFASLADNVPKILKDLKDDPRSKLAELQTLVGSLSIDAVESKDTLYSEDTESRKVDYEERMKSLGVTYLSMGCSVMDKTFFGYRKQDLITIGGKAGSGKTWLLVYLIYLLAKALDERSDATDETFGDILLISNEMGEEEIKERLDCIQFKLPYRSFMEGTLSERTKKRYYKGLEDLKEEKSKIRIVYSCQTIDELSTIIGLYRPSAVFLDGSYLMEGKMAEGWEKITYITRNLKRLAKNFKVPIINTTQLRRGSSKSASKLASDGMDDFAYGNSFVQDSDIAIRMFQDADMKYHDQIGCEVVKARRVVSGSTLLFKNDLESMTQSITLVSEDGPKEPIVKTDY